MSEPPFEPPGVVLFRVSFRVNGSSAAEFYQFIERVERQLRGHIQSPRFFGNSMTTMLPRSRDPRRWFVIVLESRDRETNHSVTLFIEAETIYLRGYQNENGQVFEFKQDDGKSYLTSKKRSASSSKGINKPTQLSFSCNYNSIVKSTQKKGPGGSVLEAGVTLETAGYDERTLRHAVVELAQGRNPPGESQHTTARNLLRVIVRFCESIRFWTVRREMMNLWKNSSGGGGSASASASAGGGNASASVRLSSECVGQINNWSCIGRNLVESHRNANFAWSQYLSTKTGVGSVARAEEVVALVLFHIRQDEDVDVKKGELPDPDKDNPPRWDDDRRGPGGGSAGGASWGVLADEEPPRLYTMPEEPVMEILSVCTPGQRIYGRITVTDGFGAQTIYQRSRDNYQSPSDDSGDVMMLELDVQTRAIPAYDCVDIDVDLYDAYTQASLAAGHMSWNSCDFEANSDRYDVPRLWHIGEGVALEYIVYSKAVQAAVGVTVDNGGARGRGWFTTRNTMMGMAPRRRPMYAGIGDDHLLRGHHVAAVPVGFKLEVAVGFEHEGGSPEPVQLTVEQEPIVGGGIYTNADKLQDGSFAKVNMVWNLLRKEPLCPTITPEDPTTTPEDPATGHDELK